MDDKFEKFAQIMKTGFDSMQNYMHENFPTKDELGAMEGRTNQRLYEIDCQLGIQSGMLDKIEQSINRLDGQVESLEIKMDAMSELYQGHENRILKLEDAVLE